MWIAKLDLKDAYKNHFHEKPIEAARAVVQAIDKAIDDTPSLPAPKTLKRIRDKFANARENLTEKRFNALMDLLYDYGDIHRVWIATVL